jgi:Lipocalin-like domain
MNAPAKTTQAYSSQTGDPRLVGTWKLKSCFMEDVETKERKAVWGERPNGTLTLTSAGHWIVVQTSEGRKAPQTDDDRCAAFRSMLTYAGKYRVEGQKILIDVDIAWDESWTGTEQVRSFSIEGDRLHIEAAPQRYANLGDKVMRAVLIWQRAE